jgi:hypothetical protein
MSRGSLVSDSQGHLHAGAPHRLLHVFSIEALHCEAKCHIAGLSSGVLLNSKDYCAGTHFGKQLWERRAICKKHADQAQGVPH